MSIYAAHYVTGSQGKKPSVTKKSPSFSTSGIINDEKKQTVYFVPCEINKIINKNNSLKNIHDIYPLKLGNI